MTSRQTPRDGRGLKRERSRGWRTETERVNWQTTRRSEGVRENKKRLSENQVRGKIVKELIRRSQSKPTIRWKTMYH